MFMPCEKEGLVLMFKNGHTGKTSYHFICQLTQVKDLKDIGLQVAQRVSQAADPVRLLADISQNFPSLVSSLSQLKVCVNVNVRAVVVLVHVYLHA